MWHRKRHRRPELPVEECWSCQRDRAICRSKISFATWQEASEWVDEFNRTYGYTKTVVRYRCRWCSGWHMATARTKNQVKRVEKARRKDAVRYREEHDIS
jgi:hypothetical protein